MANGNTSEPALLYGAIATVVVAVASLFSIVIDPDTVTGVIASGVPLLTAILIRSRVTPV